MPSTIRLTFEVINKRQTSCSDISFVRKSWLKCGIIYVPVDVIVWKMLAERWVYLINRLTLYWNRGLGRRPRCCQVKNGGLHLATLCWRLSRGTRPHYFKECLCDCQIQYNSTWCTAKWKAILKYMNWNWTLVLYWHPGSLSIWLEGENCCLNQVLDGVIKHLVDLIIMIIYIYYSVTVSCFTLTLFEIDSIWECQGYMLPESYIISWLKSLTIRRIRQCHVILLLNEC